MPRRLTAHPAPVPRSRPIRTTVRALLLALVLAVPAVALTGADAAAPPAGPRGWLLPVTKSGAGVAVVGWAAPTDRVGTALVRIEMDDRRLGRLVADRPAAWVARRRPNYGPNHGFRGQFPAPAGTHRVCAYVVLDPAQDHKTLLNCQTITLAFDPTGGVDPAVISPGHVTVKGWAVDPDAVTTPIRVRLHIDHRLVAGQLAASARTDVRVPGAGTAHGYQITWPISEGTHTVCMRGVNVGPGANALLGCRTLHVSFSPSAAISAVYRRPLGVVALSGWAVDPDTDVSVSVTLTADGHALGSIAASAPGAAHSGHRFWARYRLPDTVRGRHTLCVIAHNLGTYGQDSAPQCVTRWLSWNPRAAMVAAAQHSPGAQVTGWAFDPDTSHPIRVAITADGRRVAVLGAARAGGAHPGHAFTATVPLGDGRHTLCATALNVLAGNGNSRPACRSVTLKFEPFGTFESLRRKGSTRLVAIGWAVDPDSANPIKVAVRVDNGRWTTAPAGLARTDVAAAHPGAGARHGFAVALPVDGREHTVCVRALNVGAGRPFTRLGCKVVIAVHPVVPAPVTGVHAVAGYGGAQVSWTAPVDDGGAPWTSYTVTAIPGGITRMVGPTARSATITGLKSRSTYSFAVVATNVAGRSKAALSTPVTTDAQPPAQTTPAPVSTSRYIRNIHGAGINDLAAMRAEGAADAVTNPPGHGYLVLLDIGGQVEASQGVILSAGIQYVSYADLVRDLNAYVDGYASKQHSSAPVIIALGTNNDIDVTSSSGASWADHVVDPVAGHAARYRGITIAGADDIEPGFRAGYLASAAWLRGYLAATRAPFVFNGSADGCSWSGTNGYCNNGWTARGLQWLAGGAAPVRIINLPQIYNTTMAQQWRYISLTGVVNGRPAINFGGPLTEYTACRQDRSCGSLTPRTAWQTMWAALNAEPALRPRSLPYSTDLRIDW